MGKIHDIRISRGMTQQELAELAGISRTGLSLIENGISIPKIDTLKKIASALMMPWQSLIED